MRILVESLKRLYEDGRVTKEQIAERVISGKVSEEEYKYIMKEEYGYLGY